jgi:hypothetical protein
MDKFMKFWGKYGYMFHLASAALLFTGGDTWLGVTNVFLAIPLFFESQNKKYE